MLRTVLLPMARTTGCAVVAFLSAVSLRAAPAPMPLGWTHQGSVRFAPVQLNGTDHTGFVEVTGPSVGITFTNTLSDERAVTTRSLLSGSGVAAGDFDGDGWCDLYFCGLEAGNRLFRNLGGWRFDDVTASAGVACPGQFSTGAAFADIDGDGRLDLLVTALDRGLRVFHNEGDGRFREVTPEAGVASRHGSMSFTLGDVEGDGDLDIYVANYSINTIRDRPTTKIQARPVNGKPVVVAVDGRPATAPDLTNRFEIAPTGDVIEYSEPSDFFLNDGHGRFTRASFTDGRFLDEDGHPLSQPPRDWSLSARFYDFTGDGAPDLYVCNDLFTPDRIWINDGHGHFRALPRLAVRHTSTFSMGMDFGDLNRDGAVDFYVVDMVSRDLRDRKIQIAGLSPNFAIPGVVDDRPQIFQNTLQINRGDGTFAELAYFAGLNATEWSWQPVFLDVDLDGYEDILVVNGTMIDYQNADMGARIESAMASRRMSPGETVALFKQYPGLILTNLCFRNLRDLRFEEVGRSWGFSLRGISQGLALADLDNDGDLDVVLNNFNGPPVLCRNDSTAPRLLVRLKGAPPNTAGVGARIRVTGGPVPQSQEILAGGRYLSSDEPVRVFATGKAARVSVEVTWRDGRQTIVPDVSANSICEIEQNPATVTAAPPKPSPLGPLFADVSARLNHTHQETPFDDFSHQFLLPRLYSQLGPGVAWIDLDRDGHDDLVVGTGSRGRVAAFHNSGKGQFQPLTQPPFSTPLTRDTTSILALPATNGVRLLVGSANYEDRAEAGSVARTFDLAAGRIIDQLPGQRSSTGPMALTDVNGDGRLDLFVGGRITPLRYPEPAASLLFLGENDGFVLDRRNTDRLAKLGLVSGAVFSDLDGDGAPDLVLACEWGPVRVFHNRQGLLQEVTDEEGLAQFTGWWTGVSTVDLDGDGRLDIVAGNWGLNTRYSAPAEQPRRVYYGDFDGSGVLGLVEACRDPALGAFVCDRDLRVMARGLPFLRERFSNHESYARASMAEMLGPLANRTSVLEVRTFSSMAFLNRGGSWQPVPLPAEAQFAPAMAVVPGDFDGDGNEDVFLSQNFFPNEPFTKRNDAGLGLLLKGDGSGHFRALPATESGIRCYGDQRGAAAADFDEDGRLDLVVGQNASETKLFRNAQARPGLRVRLRGPALNPTGIGAVVRVQFGQRLGPAQEIHAGSGYWSQDSAVLVFGTPAAPSAVQVRWPGGRTVQVAVPPGAAEVTVGY